MLKFVTKNKAQEDGTEDGMNECEERKGIHRFLVQLFEGEKKAKFERNARERTVNQLDKKTM